jgi:phosphoenolpyruvate carboxylase
VDNVSTSVLTASLEIMRQYSALVEDATLRERIFGLVESEYLRTRRVLEELYAAPLPQRRPLIYRMLTIREPALAMLHANRSPSCAAGANSSAAEDPARMHSRSSCSSQ